MGVTGQRSRGGPALRSVAASPSLSESLLIFSDVHLGSDLNDCSPNVAKRSVSIDRDLTLLLAHYRGQAPSGDRWRIVIAGDFIDFIGMTIAPRAERVSEDTTAEEHAHGLGNSAEHVRLKLRLVAERHHTLFAELGGFVADGNALTLVHGNHDIEFHWDEVKEDFRAMLLEHAQRARPDVDLSACSERIEFSPWFFYRDGVAYIEHGHQYDRFCATEHVMAPLSPLDPRRIARGLSDVLIRFVVRPTIGMKEHGHENLGIVQYFAFAARLGISGLFRLGARFASAVFELFRLRRAHLSAAASTLRAEHVRRVELLAEASRIGKARMLALLSLQVQPITHSIRGILASVLLDRLALAVVALLSLVGVAIVGAFHGRALYAAIAVVVGWALFHRHLSRTREVDPAEVLRLRAAQLATLFPVAFVVMGHTHVPVQSAAGAATYINLGSWSEEEPQGPDDHAPRAPRTHLVIHVRDARPVAQLLTWESATGPVEYRFPETTDAS